MLQPAKVEELLDELTVLLVQCSVASGEPVPSVMLRVTEPLVGLPPESVSATTGWVPNAVPPVPPVGEWVKLRCATAPVPLMSKELLSTLSAPELAVSL